MSASRLSIEPPRVALLTLGCKLNQAESEAIAGELGEAGCSVGDEPQGADVYVVNTCAVTHVAARKSRHLVRLVRRASPEARVVVTGCYVETESREFFQALGADAVVGNAEKESLAARLLDGRRPIASPSSVSGRRVRLRTRSFLKVQEGCDDVCAFCIVPRTRGRQRSVSAAAVLQAARRLEREDVQEIVVTGTQLGAYGLDLDDAFSLGALLRMLLQETDVARIRLSSLQPTDVTPGLLELWQDRRLCRHFHMALQSGSDAVLSRMRRRYSIEEFRRALSSIHAAVPDAAVTTDVLAGFPGETEAEFEETRRFCEESEFAGLHVFPFSRRPGTLAARMPHQIPERVKRERVQRMLDLGRHLRDLFLRRFQGRSMDVLWESKKAGRNGTPAWEGLTDNYIRTFVESGEPLENRLLPTRLVDRCDAGYEGQLIG